MTGACHNACLVWPKRIPYGGYLTRTEVDKRTKKEKVVKACVPSLTHPHVVGNETVMLDIVAVAAAVPSTVGLCQQDTSTRKTPVFP